MKLPKIFEIKDTGEKLEPGKLAIAGMMISAIVIALIIYIKKGYYDTGYSKGQFADLLECYTRTVISISLSVIPCVLMFVFHLIVKIKNKTYKALTVLLLIAAVLLCANGLFEIISLANAYITGDELRKDLCFVLIGGHLLSTGSLSNGIKILKILPPA